MSIPVILIWTIIGILLFRHHLNKNEKSIGEKRKKYYDKLSESTSTRKKEIESSAFLHLELEDDFLKSLNVDEKKIDSILEYKEKELLDFSKHENTELMLKYGTASITRIQLAEENLEILRNKLYDLSRTLFDKADYENVLTIVKELLRLKDDRTKTYMLLFDSYKELNYTKEMQDLILEIENSSFKMKNKLLREWKEE